MIRIVLALLVISFSACSTDALVPCDREGQKGQLCREYRYINSQPRGFVEFDHLGDSLVVSNYYNERTTLVKTVRERFVNGRVIIIAEQYLNEESKVQTLHYNELDSLDRIVFGANDSVIEISYEQGKRSRMSYLRGGELHRYSEYRYYMDDGKLYRISDFNSEDSLLSYRQFDYFSTGQHRVSYFTSDHHLLGRRVFSAPNGLLTSVEFRNANGTVTERTDYVYDADFNLLEKSERISDQTFKSVFLYY